MTTPYERELKAIRAEQELLPRADLLPGLDHIANFLNSLDTEGMTAKEVRSAVYAECLAPRKAWNTRHG